MPQLIIRLLWFTFQLIYLVQGLHFNSAVQKPGRNEAKGMRKNVTRWRTPKLHQ